MPRILIVDDELPVRNMLKEMLADDGYEFIEASNGEEARTAHQASPADLVITDLVMPEKSGIDLIMALKKESPDVRVIAISGGGGITGRFDYLPIAKLVGARAIIRKPFSMNELRSVVSEAFNSEAP